MSGIFVVEADTLGELVRKIRSDLERRPFHKGRYSVEIHFEGSRMPALGEAPDGGGILGEDDS